MTYEPGFRLAPIPDETFFGFVVTIGMLLGADSYGQAYRRIVGNTPTTPANTLPRNLRSITPYLPSNYQENLNLICEKHTAFPYFSAFASAHSRSKAITAMLGDERLGARSILGLAPTAFSDNRFMKHCPLCASEQWENHGRSTWIRSHQLPGVDVCYRHGVDLIESSIPTAKHGLHTSTISLPVAANSQVIASVWEAGNSWNSQSPEHLVAQLSHEMLFADWAVFADQAHSNRYRDATTKLGVQDGRRGLDWKALRGRLVDRYGDLLSRKFGITFAVDKPPDWIRRILKDSRSARHPMSHLIIMGGLFDSWVDASTHKPVKIKPTAAHKVSAARTGTPSDSLTSASSDKLPNKADPSNDEAMELPVVSSALQAKRDAVLALIRQFPDLPRCRISQRMPSRKFDWLITHDKRWMDKVLPRNEGRQQVLKKTRDKKRKAVLALIEENPKFLRSEIAALSRSAYVWLMKNDAVWMATALPKKSDRSRKTLESRRGEIIEAIRANPTKTRCEQFRGLKQTYRWLCQNDASWLESMLSAPIPGTRPGQYNPTVAARRQRLDRQFSAKIESLPPATLSSVLRKNGQANYAALSRAMGISYRKVCNFRALPATKRALESIQDRLSVSNR